MKRSSKVLRLLALSALVGMPMTADTPGFKPVTIETPELKAVGGKIAVPQGTFKPVTLKSGELRVVGGKIAVPQGTFKPVTIETDGLKVVGK
jgi:hypothetical protein